MCIYCIIYIYIHVQSKCTVNQPMDPGPLSAGQRTKMMVAIRGRSNPKRPWKKRVNLEPLRPSSFRLNSVENLMENLGIRPWKSMEYIYIYTYIYIWGNIMMISHDIHVWPWKSPVFSGNDSSNPYMAGSMLIYWRVTVFSRWKNGQVKNYQV